MRTYTVKYYRMVGSAPAQDDILLATVTTLDGVHIITDSNANEPHTLLLPLVYGANNIYSIVVDNNGNTSPPSNVVDVYRSGS